MTKNYFIEGEGKTATAAQKDYEKKLGEVKKTLQKAEVRPLSDPKKIVFTLVCSYKGNMPDDYSGPTQGTFRDKKDFTYAEIQARKAFGKNFSINAASIKATYNIGKKQEAALHGTKETPPGEPFNLEAIRYDNPLKREIHR